MLAAALAMTLLIAQTPPPVDDDEDWGIEAYVKSTPAASAPTPMPPAAPVTAAPRQGLILKPAGDWGSPQSVDENDAARFAPGQPKPVAGDCRQTENGFSCGNSEAARKLAKDLASPATPPD